MTTAARIETKNNSVHGRLHRDRILVRESKLKSETGKEFGGNDGRSATKIIPTGKKSSSPTEPTKVKKQEKSW
jgi:hypothetical protein